jgi:hypothetical protein
MSEKENFWKLVIALLWDMLVQMDDASESLSTGQDQSYIDGDDAYWDIYDNIWFGYVFSTMTKENTVKDESTNLEWVSDPSQLGGKWGTPGNPLTMTWDEAIEECQKLQHAGHNDWRLPNRQELESIVNNGMSFPAIDTNLFPHAKSDSYWTSTITQYGCENMYFLNFGPGQSNWDDDPNKKKYVRPVRNIPKPRSRSIRDSLGPPR